MMYKISLLLLPFLFAICVTVDAQQTIPLDWSGFRAQVLSNHPLAKAANLYPDQAEAALLRAKGGFDPKAFAEFSGKQFKDKNYFRYGETGIKWPILLGIELKGSYNWASGTFLNPESTLPSAGQALAGFNWSLGQGLLFDERRAALRQAYIGIEQNKAERDAALNDLLLEAAKAFWTWNLADNQLKVFESAQQQAQIRYEGLLESYRQGDKPAIDTLEAFIQLQNRRLDVAFARTDLQNAVLELRNYLWTSDNTPVRVETQPQAASLLADTFLPLAADAAETLLQTARNLHPELRKYEAKRQLLDVESRLKSEKRKPVIDLSYNLLGNGWQFFPSVDASGAGLLASDVKWGIEVSYPILNRKARGDWQITQLKMIQTAAAFQQKTVEIDNKIRQYRNEMNNLAAQIALYRDITNNYRILLEAENEKFKYGESSVFLINTREQRWLETQVKYLKLLSEYRKTEAGLQWAAGQLQGGN